MIIYLPPRW